VFHGAFFAGLFLMLQLLVADYYGSASLGTIRGFIFPWQMMANSIGPLAATLVYDFTGSYSFILSVYVVIHVMLVIALIFALPSKESWLNNFSVS
jgi:MFS family permease